MATNKRKAPATLSETPKQAREAVGPSSLSSAAKPPALRPQPKSAKAARPAPAATAVAVAPGAAGKKAAAVAAVGKAAKPSILSGKANDAVTVKDTAKDAVKDTSATKAAAASATPAAAASAAPAAAATVNPTDEKKTKASGGSGGGVAAPPAEEKKKQKKVKASGAPGYLVRPDASHRPLAKGESVRAAIAGNVESLVRGRGCRFDAFVDDECLMKDVGPNDLAAELLAVLGFDLRTFLAGVRGPVVVRALNDRALRAQEVEDLRELCTAIVADPDAVAALRATPLGQRLVPVSKPGKPRGA